MAAVPSTLAAYADRLRVGDGSDPGRHPTAVLEEAMATYRGLPSAIRSASVSEWSMYYFAALIIPTVTTAVCAGRVPPVGVDEVRCEGDDVGRVTRFWLKNEGTDASGACFDGLVAGHLEPVIASCNRLLGLSTRVLWSNAAVILDFAVGELRGEMSGTAALREAEALLEHHSGLANPFHSGARRKRKVCCLRYRLSHADICAGICPRERTRVAIAT